MKILYVAMAYEYGDPSQGPSFEEMNFRSSLEGMGHDLARFDFKAREVAVGRDEMNRELVQAASDTQPDAAFFFLFEEEVKPETIRAVGLEGNTTTFNWFADDHWRFESFTRHFAPSFDWSITTDPDSVARYHDVGEARVILSQWACNHHAYTPTPGRCQLEVTFVGQPHGSRRETIEDLRGEGLEVECWGQGWPAGRLDHADMIRVFSESRINLNLSNSSTPQRSVRARLGAWARRIPYDTRPRPSQIKGRTFEVPGCGGFLLTDRVAHLGRYFDLGTEIVTYDDPAELPGLIRYWLEHEDERSAIAQAGYKRVRAEHTYEHRFREIFATAGLA